MKMFDKGKGGLSWDYLKERHLDIVSELKSLREWEAIKAAIPESENIKDYSLLALQSVAALTREFHTEKNLLNEKLHALEERLDDTRTEMRERDSALEKRIKNLESSMEDVQRKLLLVEGIGNMLPKISELEERLEAGNVQLSSKVEERYSRLIEELVDKRIRALEEELRGSVLGIGAELAKSLREMQERDERLAVENYDLRMKLKRINSELDRVREEAEKLRKRLEEYREMNRSIEDLHRRVQEYEKRLNSLSAMEKRLMQLTGAGSLEEALNIVERMKSNCVPKSKVTPVLNELKRLQERVEELEAENGRLREKNEKLTEALKTLLERTEEGEDSTQ